MELLSTIFYLVLYIGVSYLAGSYLNLLDGVWRLVLSIILGGFLIPIAGCLFVFRAIKKLIIWLFRLG